MVQSLPSWAFQVDATDLRCLRDLMTMRSSHRHTHTRIHDGNYSTCPRYAPAFQKSHFYDMSSIYNKTVQRLVMRFNATPPRRRRPNLNRFHASTTCFSASRPWMTRCRAVPCLSATDRGSPPYKVDLSGGVWGDRGRVTPAGRLSADGDH